MRICENKLPGPESATTVARAVVETTNRRWRIGKEIRERVQWKRNVKSRIKIDQSKETELLFLFNLSLLIVTIDELMFVIT